MSYPTNERKFTTFQKNKDSLPPQAKEIIANVRNFLRDESENGIDIPKQNFKQRTIFATGVSEAIYRRVTEEISRIERGECSGFEELNRTRNARKIAHLEVARILRGLVYNFYITEKKQPTMHSLVDKIKTDNLQFDGKLSKLYLYLRKIGFRWVPYKGSRKVLLESSDIRYQRFHYLQQLSQFRQQNKPVIYIKQCYINCRHLENQHLQINKPIDRRLFIVHTSQEMGFIINCSLIFTRKCESDNKSNMKNIQLFFKWIHKELIPNLQSPSVLILDDGTYHCIQTEQDNICTKQDMIKWLTIRNVRCNPDMTKPELYTLIKTFKQQHPTYKLDELLKSRGHNVLKLPPHHPELSPIEKIWDITEDWIKSPTDIDSFKIGVENRIREEFVRNIQNNWKEFCDNVKKIEREYLEKEEIFNNITEEFLLPLEDDEDDKNDQIRDSIEIEGVVNDEMDDELNINTETESLMDICQVIKEEDDPLEINDTKQERIGDV